MSVMDRAVFGASEGRWVCWWVVIPQWGERWLVAVFIQFLGGVSVDRSGEKMKSAIFDIASSA